MLKLRGELSVNSRCLYNFPPVQFPCALPVQFPACTIPVRAACTIPRLYNSLRGKANDRLPKMRLIYSHYTTNTLVPILNLNTLVVCVSPFDSTTQGRIGRPTWSEKFIARSLFHISPFVLRTHSRSEFPHQLEQPHHPHIMKSKRRNTHYLPDRRASYTQFQLYKII